MVICKGYEINKKAYPSIAGLNGLLPRPPYNCLPKIIANATPTTTTHHGAMAGIEIANKIPVNTAEPSLIDSTTLRPRSATKIDSTTNAEITPSNI